jgi:hypothetical protein
MLDQLSRVDRIAAFSDPSRSRRDRAGADREDSYMSKNLRILVASAILAGLAACAAPPPAPVITAPPAKPLDAKTQLENHM